MDAVKIFLDTNIVLDYFTGRMNDDRAKTIVQIGRDYPQFELCISVLTAVKVLYVAKKYMPSLQPADLATMFTILPQDYKQYTDAIDLGLTDFEDALQVSCALNNSSMFMITRNPHLKAASIVSFTPQEFIEAVRNN